jgi:hypothetical protein
LQKQVDFEKVLVNVFQILANDGVKEYEIGSRLFTLEQKIIVTKRNQNGARSLFSSIKNV